MLITVIILPLNIKQNKIRPFATQGTLPIGTADVDVILWDRVYSEIATKVISNFSRKLSFLRPLTDLIMC